MCLLPEAREEYCRRARNLDDAKLLELDAYYRQNSPTSVHWQLHGIVMMEIHRRRDFRRRQLERALWLSSRRGRFIEAIKRWLISRGLWSSAVRERKQPPGLIVNVFVILWRFYRIRKQWTISSLPRNLTPLDQL